LRTVARLVPGNLPQNQTRVPPLCRVLLIAPSFSGQSFWNFRATCEVYGARFPAAPLGLITVAALLPSSWQCRLVNRNTEDLLESDLDWADLVMTGGMLPQQPDTRWCAGIGAGSVCTGVGSRAVVSAGLRSRPTSAI
jgi:hypothetical protein